MKKNLSYIDSVHRDGSIWNLSMTFLLLAFPVALIGLSGTIALLYVSLAMILGALVSAPIMSFMAYLKKK